MDYYLDRSDGSNSQSPSVDLVVPELEAWGLYWTSTTLQVIVNAIPGMTAPQNQALVLSHGRTLVSRTNGSTFVLHKGDPDITRRSRKLAEEVFGDDCEGECVYKEGALKQHLFGVRSFCSYTTW